MSMGRAVKKEKGWENGEVCEDVGTLGRIGGGWGGVMRIGDGR